jgi:hypothetical protein
MLSCQLMRLSRQIVAQARVVLALVVLASPVLAETAPPSIAADIERQDPDIDVYALMSGNCPTLKLDGTKFTCKTMGFFHGMHGRVSFTVVLDDPADESHIVSFSGPGSRQASSNVYYLAVDRVFLNSKDRPREDGVPVPLPVASTGTCKQIGNLATGQVSSIACTASDSHGKTFELQFQSDGSPILVRRIRQAPVDSQDPFAKE